MEKKRLVQILKKIFMIVIVAHIVGVVVFAFFDKGCNESPEQKNGVEEKNLEPEDAESL